MPLNNRVLSRGETRAYHTEPGEKKADTGSREQKLHQMWADSAYNELNTAVILLAAYGPTGMSEQM